MPRARKPQYSQCSDSQVPEAYWMRSRSTFSLTTPVARGLCGNVSLPVSYKPQPMPTCPLCRSVSFDRSRREITILGIEKPGRRKAFR